ncbi:hypothetical protein GQ53DRAFT_840594 [Thozetella sp. PMI_491]|nr:hypothetical protein GQ53DRAFT_840594 [Thozetella sp. PMI_491]
MDTEMDCRADEEKLAGSLRGSFSQPTLSQSHVEFGDGDRGTTKGSSRETNDCEQWLIQHRQDRYQTFLDEYSKERGLAPSVVLPKSETAFGIVARYIAANDFVQLLDLARELCSAFPEDNRSDATPRFIHLAFYLFGVLTALYDPVAKFDGQNLEIRFRREARRRSISKHQTWSLCRQPVCDVSEEWIGDTLCRYGGGRLPVPKHALVKNSEPRRSFLESDHISCTNLSYYTLSKLVGITIDWTSSLCEHLDFDATTQTLKLFRYPSLCAAMAAENDKTFLCRFLRNCREDSSSAGGDSLPGLSSTDLFKEILCTFRLIFGQDRRSWKIYARDTTRSWTRWLRRPQDQQETELDADARARIHTEDPLLLRLCGRDWVQQRIYDDIDAPFVRTVYSAVDDFPYFGEKLAVIQQFVCTRDAVDLNSLWTDRRDIHRYYTLWLVVILGILALFLQIISVVVAIVQTAGTFLVH